MDEDFLLLQQSSGELARSARRRLSALLLGLATALALLCAARTYLIFDFTAAAMGKATSGLWGEGARGGTVHCDGIRATACLQAYERAGRPPAWLWIGNSQLHGMNRYQAGEKSAPMLLHDKLRSNGVYLVTNSLPNATIAEFITIVHGIGSKYDLRKVIIPVVLNGMRGGSVRESEWPIFREKEVLKRLQASRTFDQMRPIIALATVGGVVEPTNEDLARSVENRANSALGTIWPLWSERDKLRTLARYAYHVGRHKVFGVTAQTRRPLLGTGYVAQMKLLGKLLDDLRNAGISALVYVPPYRQDIQGPYIPAEYALFKAELAELAKVKGAEFAMLDDIVPGSDWGMVRDFLFGTEDYDFMHFTADGHSRLAEALYHRLAPAGFQARAE